MEKLVEIKIELDNETIKGLEDIAKKHNTDISTVITVILKQFCNAHLEDESNVK